jgi:hypothetical protein
VIECVGARSTRGCSSMVILLVIFWVLGSWLLQHAVMLDATTTSNSVMSRMVMLVRGTGQAAAQCTAAGAS